MFKEVKMGIVESMRLDGKKGFVTGAARGIGKCTATGFAEAGADVAIVDLDYEEAVKTAGEIAAATGRKVIAVKCDCTDKEQVEAMVRTVVEELGGLDFCHNNAGICINALARCQDTLSMYLSHSVRTMRRKPLSSS